MRHPVNSQPPTPVSCARADLLPDVITGQSPTHQTRKGTTRLYRTPSQGDVLVQTPSRKAALGSPPKSLERSLRLHADPQGWHLSRLFPCTGHTLVGRVRNHISEPGFTPLQFCPTDRQIRKNSGATRTKIPPKPCAHA